MIPVGRQYQTIRELRDDLEELLAPELGTFPNGLPAIWVEDQQAPVVLGGVSVTIQPRFSGKTTGKLNNQSNKDGEWKIEIRQKGDKDSFTRAIDKMESLPQRMRIVSLPFMEGVVPQVTFYIAANLIRNTYQ